jgi:hypothetical protein
VSARLDQKRNLSETLIDNTTKRHQGIAEEIKALAEEKKNDEQPSELSDRRQD